VAPGIWPFDSRAAASASFSAAAWRAAALVAFSSHLSILLLSGTPVSSICLAGVASGPGAATVSCQLPPDSSLDSSTSLEKLPPPPPTPPESGSICSAASGGRPHRSSSFSPKYVTPKEPRRPALARAPCLAAPQAHLGDSAAGPKTPDALPAASRPHMCGAGGEWGSGAKAAHALSVSADESLRFMFQRMISCHY